MFRKCRVLLLGLLVFPLLSLARVYQVNVVVFKHTTADAFSAEHWMCHLLPADIRGAINLENESAKNTVASRYQLLPSHLRGLQFEAAQLQKQGGYQVLAHLSWTQPSMRSPAWVRITGGEVYGDTTELNGKIRIVPNTYLNVYTQLYLTEPASLFKGVQPDPSTSLCTIKLTDYRQIKLNDLNYIDHPLFGVLVQVRR